MLPHKTYIPHIPAFVYLVGFFLQPKYNAVGSFSWHYFPSSSLLCIIIFFSVFTNLNLNRMLSSTIKIFLLLFNKKYYNLTFSQQIFNTCYFFFEEMMPEFVIHNINDYIIQFGDDVNI